jgi:hypothetical protein
MEKRDNKWKPSLLIVFLEGHDVTGVCLDNPERFRAG